eukprot:INCI7432.2.p2 GENE.INCI7432.2~~INCI7432.2.p2  ORF type:complete len:445 (-),score=90.91 INCI7432.2:2578-3912(-)
MPRHVAQVEKALAHAFRESRPASSRSGGSSSGSSSSGSEVSAELMDSGIVCVRNRGKVVLRWSLGAAKVLFEWHQSRKDQLVFAAAVEALETGNYHQWDAAAAVNIAMRSHKATSNDLTKERQDEVVQHLPRKRRRADSPAASRTSKFDSKRVSGEVSSPNLAEVEDLCPAVSSTRCSLFAGGPTVTVVVGQSVYEKDSRFQAVVLFPVDTANDAAIALSLLRQHSCVAGATHKITAFRALDGSEGCDDDGENRAGSSLRAALRKEKMTGIATCVARWYGGTNIGKVRFRHIQNCALQALRAGGFRKGSSASDAVWARAGKGRKLCEVGLSAKKPTHNLSLSKSNWSNNCRQQPVGQALQRSHVAMDTNAHIERLRRARLCAAAADRRRQRKGQISTTPALPSASGVRPDLSHDTDVTHCVVDLVSDDEPDRTGDGENDAVIVL